MINDFALCANDACPAREACLRFKAEAIAGYSLTTPFLPATGEDRCAAFEPLEGG